jgi:hypothetical protein
MMLYVVGLSSAVGWGGERFRYPILALMLPVAAMNLHSLLLRLRPAQPSASAGSDLATASSAPPGRL